MNASILKMRRENQRLRDKVFNLEAFIQKHNSRIDSQEKKQIICELVKILKIIDPYKEYHNFFLNNFNADNVSIVKSLQDINLILLALMFDFEQIENELFDYIEEELEE